MQLVITFCVLFLGKELTTKYLLCISPSFASATARYMVSHELTHSLLLMVCFFLDVPDFGDDHLTVLCLCHRVQVLQILVEERRQVSDVLRVRLAAFCQEVHQLEKVILKLVLVR